MWLVRSPSRGSVAVSGSEKLQHLVGAVGLDQDDGRVTGLQLVVASRDPDCR